MRSDEPTNARLVRETSGVGNPRNQSDVLARKTWNQIVELEYKTDVLTPVEHHAGIVMTPSRFQYQFL